jgi:hypothetical protein
MLSAFIPSVVKLKVSNNPFMLNVIVLSVIVLSVILLSVIMLSVVAPVVVSGRPFHPL